jgi:hypothetical protein
MNNNGTLKLTIGEYFIHELRYSSDLKSGGIEIDLSSGNPAAAESSQPVQSDDSDQFSVASQQ